MKTAVVLLVCLLPLAAVAQSKDGVPLMKPALAASAPAKATVSGTAGTPRTITWDALVPAGWDPFKDFKDMNFQMLDDGDPRDGAWRAGYCRRHSLGGRRRGQRRLHQRHAIFRLRHGSQRQQADKQDECGFHVRGLRPSANDRR